MHSEKISHGAQVCTHLWAAVPDLRRVMPTRCPACSPAASTGWPPPGANGVTLRWRTARAEGRDVEDVWKPWCPEGSSGQGMGPHSRKEAWPVTWASFAPLEMGFRLLQCPTAHRKVLGATQIRRVTIKKLGGFQLTGHSARPAPWCRADPTAA